MTNVVSVLEDLGLAQYASRLDDEGFDTWETLMDITESDLETLGFKLGHRRKLQRAIANARASTGDNVHIHALRREAEKPAGKSLENSSPTPMADTSVHRLAEYEMAAPSKPSTSNKRKYRRHPKPDTHAPERPPSAYVLFSNQMREVLKGKDLSFSEMAKLVGERWQELDAAEKEPCERKAQAMKEVYYLELAEYKKTPEYAAHQQYLAEFKARNNHANDNPDPKRPKLHGEGACSVRSNSNEPLGDDVASRTDESLREPSPALSATMHKSTSEASKENPVTVWRSELASASTALKASIAVETAPRNVAHHTRPIKSDVSDHVSYRSDLPIPPERSLDLRSSAFSTTHNIGFQSGPSRGPYRRDFSSWLPDVETLPMLTREDTVRTSGTSESEREGVHRWPLLPPTLPSIDDSKSSTTRFLSGLADLDRSAIANPAERDRKSSHHARPQQRQYIPSLQTEPQPRLPRIEHTDGDRSPRPDFAQSPARSIKHSSSSAASQNPPEQQNNPPSNRSQEKERGLLQTGYHNRDRDRYPRAEMNISSLLRASEHLDDDNKATASVTRDKH